MADFLGTDDTDSSTDSATDDSSSSSSSDSDSDDNEMTRVQPSDRRTHMTLRSSQNTNTTQHALVAQEEKQPQERTGLKIILPPRRHYGTIHEHVPIVDSSSFHKFSRSICFRDRFYTFLSDTSS